MLQNTLKLLNIFLLVTLLTSCASNLKLFPPKDINLTGTWLLDVDLSEDVIVIMSKPRASNKPQGGGRHSRGGRPSVSGKPDISSTPHFNKPALMTATEMTIDQVKGSMGIAYLGALYRDIDWGKSEKLGKKMLAGWSGSSLIITTQNKRIKLKETYSIDADGKSLTLEIKLSGNKGKNTFKRVFRKRET